MNFELDIPLDVLGPAPVLGFDIGRVIISPGDGPHDTSFLHGSEDDAMRTPPYPGAFETIARLTEAVDGRAFIVSKCGPNVERRSRRWLSHWNFHATTGIPAAHLHFCRKRHEKAIPCQRLGVGAFVDDRPDVLRHLEAIVPLRLLFGPQPRGRTAPPGAIEARDWAAVGEILGALVDPR
jgi:hypothetical protein